MEVSQNRCKIRQGVLEVSTIEAQGIIPFKELDVKRLEGEWKGFLRMRSGRVRVIFRIDKEEDVFLVYGIDYRGDVYK
jgi:mRNA interferase RelE/StbE